ncbi:hypothetical protein [Mycobacterium marinum]|uniref:hypothetical protein n=1 Tax=Mycobacterium marinum TaxID=1781 RepID=UPI003569CD32
MFTLLVSWLLVAGIPALLILTTLGLGRLEVALSDDTVSASDVAEFLDHARAVDVRTLAREGMPEALEYLHRRQALALSDASAPRALTGKHHAVPGAEGAFNHLHAQLRTNPQFTSTRHVNRV